jgi:MTA/SAH nucleosidase
MGETKMRIAIISAMSSEIEAVIDILDKIEKKKVGGSDIYSGKYKENEIICAVSYEGKVNAAVCAQSVILLYKPDAVINLGVGGGIDPSLKPGDVVVATSVVQHDFNCEKRGYAKGQVCNFETPLMKCDDGIREKLFDCAKEIDGITVTQGIVATGDQFVSSTATARRIRKEFGASVVEMESAAIGQTCLLNGIPFGVVRAVSDNGDDSAFGSFGDFLEFAVANSVKLIKRFLEKRGV